MFQILPAMRVPYVCVCVCVCVCIYARLRRTGCNKTRCTNLKIYCDKTNSDITTQFVTERLLTLQVLCHLKLSTQGHNYLVHCSRPSKWRTLLTWKTQKRAMLCKTIQRNWFNGGFIRIMVKKHRRENPSASGTSHLLKLVPFVLRSRIRTDDQTTRLWCMFVRSLS
jgi:hypothetical protein